MSIRIDTSPVVSPALEPSTEPSPFPYVFRVNGRAPQLLRGWAQLTDLLSLVGMTPDCSFLIVERTDGSERWTQAIGHAHALVVELGLPDSPMRVSRAHDSPTPSPAGNIGDPDRPYALTTSANTHVEARRGDLWHVADASLLMRSWLDTATLGLDGVTLRTPDDWH